MDCLDCHIGADIRPAASLPSVRKCMFCHAKLLKDRPEVKKVIAYANKNIEIPWERVYGFSPEAHIQFRHAPHYRAGVSCSTCHGDVGKGGVATRVVTHNMGTCHQSANPHDGVCNSYGQSHDIPNLFISDGSQFTTGGAENPTLTIVTLAIRQAEHIAEEMGKNVI